MPTSDVAPVTAPRPTSPSPLMARRIILDSSDVAKYSIGQHVKNLGADRRLRGLIVDIRGSGPDGRSGPGEVEIAPVGAPHHIIVETSDFAKYTVGQRIVPDHEAVLEALRTASSSTSARLTTASHGEIEIAPLVHDENHVVLDSTNVGKYHVGQKVHGLGAARNVSGTVVAVRGAGPDERSGPGEVEIAPEETAAADGQAGGRARRRVGLAEGLRRLASGGPPPRPPGRRRAARCVRGISNFPDAGGAARFFSPRARDSAAAGGGGAPRAAAPADALPPKTPASAPPRKLRGTRPRHAPDPARGARDGQPPRLPSEARARVRSAAEAAGSALLDVRPDAWAVRVRATDQSGGLRIATVDRGGAAALAGMRAGRRARPSTGVACRIHELATQIMRARTAASDGSTGRLLVEVSEPDASEPTCRTPPRAPAPEAPGLVPAGGPPRRLAETDRGSSPAAPNTTTARARGAHTPPPAPGAGGAGGAGELPRRRRRTGRPSPAPGHGVCPATGRDYWYNSVTDESTYEDPTGRGGGTARRRSESPSPAAGSAAPAAGKGTLQPGPPGRTAGASARGRARGADSPATGRRRTRLLPERGTKRRPKRASRALRRGRLPTSVAPACDGRAGRSERGARRGARSRRANDRRRCTTRCGRAGGGPPHSGGRARPRAGAVVARGRGGAASKLRKRRAQGGGVVGAAEARARLATASGAPAGKERAASEPPAPPLPRQHGAEEAPRRGIAPGVAGRGGPRGEGPRRAGAAEAEAAEAHHASCVERRGSGGARARAQRAAAYLARTAGSGPAAGGAVVAPRARLARARARAAARARGARRPAGRGGRGRSRGQRPFREGEGARGGDRAARERARRAGPRPRRVPLGGARELCGARGEDRDAGQGDAHGGREQGPRPHRAR